MAQNTLCRALDLVDRRCVIVAVETCDAAAEAIQPVLCWARYDHDAVRREGIGQALQETAVIVIMFQGINREDPIVSSTRHVVQGSTEGFGESALKQRCCLLIRLDEVI